MSTTVTFEPANGKPEKKIALDKETGKAVLKDKAPIPAKKAITPTAAENFAQKKKTLEKRLEAITESGDYHKLVHDFEKLEKERKEWAKKAQAKQTEYREAMLNTMRECAWAAVNEKKPLYNVIRKTKEGEQTEECLGSFTTKENALLRIENEKKEDRKNKTTHYYTVREFYPTDGNEVTYLDETFIYFTK